jgi:hypothetical protein
MLYLLQDKIVKSQNLDDLFANFVIINFNYDRCIEQFLYNAVQQLYRVDEKTSAELLNKWNKIYHPYGSVGVLPWQDGKQRLAFGSAEPADLRALSQQIFTFNEQMAGGGSVNDIRTAFIHARTIVFLGFHFHQQNMDLLQTGNGGRAADIYATTVDRAGPELAIIETQIRNALTTQRQVNIHLRPIHCVGLLREYGTTLLQ